MTARYAAAAIGLILWSAGCGSIGEPLPPRLRIPEKASDFEARQVADRIEIRWSGPSRTTEGDALEGLSKLLVYALDIAPDGAAITPNLLEQLGEVVREVDPEGDDDGRYAVTLSAAPRYGKLTIFAVRSQSRRGRWSEFSEFSTLAILPPPSAPDAPRLTAKEDGIAVEWPPVNGAAGYLVERSTDGGKTFTSVSSSAEPQWQDRAADWGTEYRYRIRAEIASGASRVPGEPSKPVAITPEDRFPPAPPEGLQAIAAPASIELAWSPSAAADLAGYRLRRDGNVITPELLTQPSYSDGDIQPGAAYSYQVSAVDKNGNESAPSNAVAVSASQ